MLVYIHLLLNDILIRTGFIFFWTIRFYLLPHPINSTHITVIGISWGGAFHGIRIVLAMSQNRPQSFIWRFPPSGSWAEIVPLFLLSPISKCWLSHANLPNPASPGLVLILLRFSYPCKSKISSRWSQVWISSDWSKWPSLLEWLHCPTSTSKLSGLWCSKDRSIAYKGSTVQWLVQTLEADCKDWSHGSAI